MKSILIKRILSFWIEVAKASFLSMDELNHELERFLDLGDRNLVLRPFNHNSLTSLGRLMAFLVSVYCDDISLNTSVRRLPDTGQLTDLDR